MASAARSSSIAMFAIELVRAGEGLRLGDRHRGAVAGALAAARLRHEDLGVARGARVPLAESTSFAGADVKSGIGRSLHDDRVDTGRGVLELGPCLRRVT